MDFTDISVSENMRNSYFYQFMMICLLISHSCCTNKRLKIRNNEITRISFASGGCYGRCPFLAIEVDSSLNYKYYGGLYSEKPGFYMGTITPELWDSINIGFERVDFKHLDSSYQASVDDLATQTIIFYSNRRKIINAQSASLPRSVDSLLHWIMFSYRRVNLVKSADSLSFYANLQYGVTMPPPIRYLVRPKVKP
jgi:hypothetical protein